MNTGTPAYKRVARAEKGREEWKVKALQRREEAEALKRSRARQSMYIRELEQENARLQEIVAEEKQRAEYFEAELGKKK